MKIIPLKSAFHLYATRLAVVAFVLLTGISRESRSQSFNPEKNDRVVILGNTFADRMRYFGYFESLLQQQYPEHRLTVRNMGWSADEVGLQPRPLHFPGPRREVKREISDPDDLSFSSWGEAVNMPVALNFKGLHQSLTEEQAAIIFMCFGLNEAFSGAEGLPRFEKELALFISELRSQRYNGKKPPQLVLVSPMAHEAIGGYYPKPDAHNESLGLYTAAMKKVAASHQLLFIDLFTPSQQYFRSSKAQLTINGIHLNAQGYLEAARWMGAALGFAPELLKATKESEVSGSLRQVVKMKDDHFFYRWRAVNGEYIYGRRREPFGVVSFPPELEKLHQMTIALDEVIWEMAATGKTGLLKKAQAIVDESDNPAAQEAFLVTGMTGRQSRPLAGDHTHHPKEPAGVEQFTVPEGYEVNLFASEKDFPLAKPVAMAFDAKGRLWVATMPTYPQYIPGVPVHDKLVVLEDTDGDGKADKHTVFADNLYLPLGFELANGGVYVSQEPDLLFLKDTDGDGKADLREVVLTGFGSEDSHHATHAFVFGQDGGLYFNEGTFLNSQIETPYGPVRSYNGTTFRYAPRTGKLEPYISYPYYNPWGNVFDRWGTHFVGDASDGSNYFATPMTGKIDYPDKHPRINMFTTTRVRPTAGLEIVSSRNFPDAVQGNLLINNTIGFQGIKQHKIVPAGSGFTSEEVEPLLQSSDPNFRPVDLEFGPDGALYVVDWYNPLISHGENPPRDPARDKTHGRIWRIHYTGRPLLKQRDITSKSVVQLLELLKEHEDRLRYRARTQLSAEAPEKVLPALRKWVKGLNPRDTAYEHHLLEALWLFQDFDAVEGDLLEKLLQAKDYRARAAATRVIRYWSDRLPDPVTLLDRSAQDQEARVRIEAITALSHFSAEKSVDAAIKVLLKPTDYYLDYAIRETFLRLKPTWLALFKNRTDFLNEQPDQAAFLLGLLSEEELAALPSTSLILRAQLEHPGLGSDAKAARLEQLSQLTDESKASLLLQALERTQQKKGDTRVLTRLLLTLPGTQLTDPVFEKSLQTNTDPFVQSLRYAAMLTAGRPVREQANANPVQLLRYLEALPLLVQPDVKANEQATARSLTNALPETIRKQASEAEATQLTRAAYRAWLQLTGDAAGKRTVMKELLESGSPYVPLLAELLLPMSDQELQQQYAAELAPSFLSYAGKVNESQRFEPQYNQLVHLGRRLSGLSQRPDLDKQLEALLTLEMTIAAIPAQMLFDKKEITVTTGRLVALHFDNPDLMPHNIVLVAPGAEEKVGNAADAMASGEKGFEKHFVPDLPEVLFASPLINSNERYTLKFKAPAEPGEYPYICSFPGHWRVMKGIMKVVEK